MSRGSKRPFAEVMPTAQHIISVLAPFCERIEVGGSLRRKRPFIGDIEIVALPQRARNLFGEPVLDKPTALDLFLADKVGGGMIKNGNLYKQFGYGRFMVDLVLPASAAHWGAIYMIRTGSHEFNMWMMNRHAPSQRVRFRNGLLYDSKNTLILTHEETAVFAALNLPFIPPTRRDDGRWRQE